MVSSLCNRSAQRLWKRETQIHRGCFSELAYLGVFCTYTAGAEANTHDEYCTSSFYFSMCPTRLSAFIWLIFILQTRSVMFLNTSRRMNNNFPLWHNAHCNSAVHIPIWVSLGQFQDYDIHVNTSYCTIRTLKRKKGLCLFRMEEEHIQST